MKNNLINKFLKFFADVQAELEKMVLKNGEVIIVREDGSVIMEATGELAPDGSHELESGDIVETLNGFIIPKKEDEVEIEVERENVEQLKKKISELEAELKSKEDMYKKKDMKMSELEKKVQESQLELAKLIKVQPDEIKIEKVTQLHNEPAVERIIAQFKQKLKK